MEKKRAFFYFTLSLLGLIPLAMLVSQRQVKVSAISYRNQSYVCGSVHFGMSDSTLQAKTYNTSQGFCNLTTLNSQWDNVEITASNGYNCFNNSTSKRPIKIGKGTTSATFMITLDKSIIGMTIYAVATSENDLKVNGANSPIPSENITIKAGGSQILTYTPYQFDVSTTRTITLTLKTGVVYVSDIALRIVE